MVKMSFFWDRILGRMRTYYSTLNQKWRWLYLKYGFHTTIFFEGKRVLHAVSYKVTWTPQRIEGVWTLFYIFFQTLAYSGCQLYSSLVWWFFAQPLTGFWDLTCERRVPPEASLTSKVKACMILNYFESALFFSSGAVHKVVFFLWRELT